MAYWWVNQNQTGQHEIAGGYMWSPRRNQNGAYNQFCENMKRFEPGDIVFFNAKQDIRHLGIVKGRAIAGDKPSEFGLAEDYWHDEGWFVPVEWYKVPRPISPKSIPSAAPTNARR